MSATITLKEPLNYDKAEVAAIVIGRTSEENVVPEVRAARFTLWPFREEDGKRVYSPKDRLLRFEIDDLEKPQTDPLMEDLRQKAKQADGLLVMGVNVVKGT